MKVYLALEETADHLTSRNLLRILRVTGITDQTSGAVHICPGSWLALVGVSEVYQRTVEESLRNIGYECGVFRGKIDELSTFGLGNKKEGRQDALSA